MYSLRNEWVGVVYDVALYHFLICFVCFCCFAVVFGFGIFVCFVSLGITLFGWVIGLVWLFRGKVSL